MSINFKQVTSGTKANSDDLNQMSADAVNGTDRIHPQYFSTANSVHSHVAFNVSGGALGPSCGKTVFNNQMINPSFYGEYSGYKVWRYSAYPLAQWWDVDEISRELFTMQNARNKATAASIRFAIKIHEDLITPTSCPVKLVRTLMKLDGTTSDTDVATITASAGVLTEKVIDDTIPDAAFTDGWDFIFYRILCQLNIEFTGIIETGADVDIHSFQVRFAL